jgi:hypothetical protein
MNRGRSLRLKRYAVIWMTTAAGTVTCIVKSGHVVPSEVSAMSSQPSQCTTFNRLIDYRVVDDFDELLETCDEEEPTPGCGRDPAPLLQQFAA